ncbi:MAG: hypothetical protein NTZ04_08855 [Chloroflexi bacterium]|nr:hypothetical protein [Chloroflexota bacterium]
MNFETVRKEHDWIEFLTQADTNVTYMFVFNRMITRLRGASDILYIGKTHQSIGRRYEQETSVNNTAGNTQQTNIRMTHVFKELGIANVKCYYTRTLRHTLSADDRTRWLGYCRTWDKKFCLQLEKQQKGQTLEIPLEKYLLVCYAADNLEVPPMNNRM